MPVTNPCESSLGLSASPSAPFWARRHTGDVLDRWGVKLDGLVELVVTELITNGVKASGVKLDLGWNEPMQQRRPSHAELGNVPVVRLRLVLDHSSGKLLAQVWDNNPQPPQEQPPDLEAEGGRGLALIGVFCQAWGWYWPAAPVRAGRPWPGAAARGDANVQGRFGKVVWACFDLGGEGCPPPVSANWWHEQRPRPGARRGRA